MSSLKAMPADTIQHKKSSGGAHHFLELPGELRNQIYDFALYEPDGLHYQYQLHDESFKLYRSSCKREDVAKHTEANQLKYVCRQLYAETAGYGLGLNSLKFTRISLLHPSAAQQFLAFVEACSASQLHQIRQVDLDTHINVLKTKKGPTNIDVKWTLECGGPILDVIRFCWAHPKATVNIRSFEGAPLENESIRPVVADGIKSLVQWRYLMGCVILGTYRGANLSRLLPDPSLLQICERRIKSQHTEVSLDLLNAPNIKFRLRGEFDEEEFRGKWLDGSGWWSTLPYQVEGGIDATVEEVRGWYQNGI
ncbi:hypothetical protein K491DRAFT_683736 [Lophiostoma macrostomum CBS 122681]|uniref:Uncharacterized protein n=1 Tax=Lophiostoma macrostomum CBS 122681 TaxID=1314788 RepID=A0A6A6SRF1_9PLEO|nr:hypothetical protein K491DRAFT_683736 [Lophiostoma macrostomum CBS 122681]